MQDACEGRGPIDWAEALAGHGRWLRLVILARLGERQAVEDVLQEVALAAVRAPSPPVDPTRLPAWLYRLAIRQALLYRRRLGRRRRLTDRHAARADPAGLASGADPLDWLVRDERGRLVREAVGRLPQRDAEILLLKYAEDLTARALADRLGVGLAAVEARLHRARGRLRAELAASGVVEAGARPTTQSEARRP